LRTGDQGIDGAISTWLERHDVEVVGCADPFEACAFALTQRGSAPDLAFIGVDWLAPEELAIVDYLREIWPELSAVVYGGAQATARLEPNAPALVCRSAEGLRRMLADSPDALLSQPRAAAPQSPPDDGWRPHPAAPAPDVQRVSPKDMPVSRRTIQTHDAEMLAAELARRAAPQDSDATVGKRPPSAHEILTREELAALLADDEE
jgi:hypothetical protein